MAVYSERYKYIFFANPQTASKAIAKTLVDSLDGQPVHRGLNEEQRGSLERIHHMSWQLVQDNGLMTLEQLNQLTKVTGVRNPYDLMVSRYLKHRARFVDEADRYKWVERKGKEGVKASIESARTQEFPQWVMAQHKDRHEKGGTANGQRRYLDHADLIIRFESLQDDFNVFLARIGVSEPIEIASRNVTTQRLEAQTPDKRHYTEFYDDASRALVAQIHAPIIERFGYHFG